ncbi:hypothetical protein HMPREF1979_00253 [Actinomyces johnsonii F0542]|uniref:Uncharacterized protein n=1 Tax=Actinomyces johnsonii F0542 TaxID=1321818 RepID=U1QW21_9ACTO|nr:hypothetical protein HMPREF1979_00253 [Actinomyces johnsonii F0542]
MRTDQACQGVQLDVAVLFKTGCRRRHTVSLWHYDSDSSVS